MLSTVLGLMIATIGIDLQSGQPRFTFGVTEFQDGVGFVSSSSASSRWRRCSPG